MAELAIAADDLSGDATRALIAHHLAGVRATIPAENVFALDIDGLRQPGITFFSGRIGDEVVVIGALKQLNAESGELKSMRVADAYRRTGAGRAMLRHLMSEARSRGMRTLWLETGSSDDFVPARRLYASEGFTATRAFGDYPDSPYSVFLRRDL